ncbi:hypothetical protein F511_10249 [Dorcoceras hygrometricum]|uniref:Mitochondrial transcription termination factor family protein n=1 Tax=Dorcoceras hygrometricum TaxID=472368 RepID=A0A2Z7D5H7_9LAMI|nr:hypothetical protein F511_10249 [Dorcoceras hygrometricum]
MAPLSLQRQYSVSSHISTQKPSFKAPQFFPIPKYLLNLRKTSFSIYIYFPTPVVSFRINQTVSCQASSISVQEEEEGENRVEDAREAIRGYLEEVGASRDDAALISSSCPAYLNSLIESIEDLDDWNSWSAADSTQEIISASVLEFKKKVRQMAERKGDKGVLPFLESLGLSLSSAAHLARYLSASHTLPQLIHKVKFVKEILFSGSDDLGMMGKNALRMMAHLSISADEDVQQTLAFFEKIQARRGGLSLLGSAACFPYLVESFPRLLFLPLESLIQTIVKFLEDTGVPKGYIRSIFLLFPPILSYDIVEVIKPRLRSYEKVGAKDHDLGKMLVKYPWILSTSMLENFQKSIDFFDGEKVPKICSSNAVKRCPLILGCSVNKLKLMMHQFSEMGMSKKKLGQIIAKSPQLLLRKPQEITQVISFLKDVGLDEDAIARALGRCPEIFAASIDKTLKKKLEFLSSVGISKAYLPRVIRKYPELFVCDVDQALLPRMRYLKKIGLSQKDIRSMVSRFSPLLGYSVEEVMQPKLEFLVNTMGFPLSEVVEYPRYLSYSLEKRIKPRYWVLKGRNIEFNLKDMLGKNDEEFTADYLGVDEMFVPPPS